LFSYNRIDSVCFATFSVLWVAHGKDSDLMSEIIDRALDSILEDGERL
jgi:hypothetical protein